MTDDAGHTEKTGQLVMRVGAVWRARDGDAPNRAAVMWADEGAHIHLRAAENLPRWARSPCVMQRRNLAAALVQKPAGLRRPLAKR